MTQSKEQAKREFQRMVTEYCWGGTWGRGVLTRKERSLINLVMLSALNRPHEFKIHMRGALTNGLTLEQIQEALHVVAVYCGIPAGARPAVPALSNTASAAPDLAIFAAIGPPMRPKPMKP